MVSRPRANDPARCLPCHLEQVDRWKAGGHSRALRTATTANVGMPVPGAAAFREPHHVATGAEGATPWMECLDGDGQRRRFPITHVIGGSKLEMYLVEHGADRRPQVLPAMWSRREDGWVPYWDIDLLATVTAPKPPGHPRFWTERSRTFVSYCNRCHTPLTRVAYDPDAGRYQVDWGAPEELGIGCVACHGDATAHVQAAEAGAAHPPLLPQDPLPNIRAVTEVESCGRCHVSGEWVALDYTPGGEFFDTFLPLLLDDTTHYWPDGRYRDHAYLYTAHVLSACYRRGGLRCTDCHDAHGDRSPAETRDRTLQACTKCHAAPPASCRSHEAHRYEPGAAKPDCVSCHMAEIVIERGHGLLHDHRIAVPDPTLTRLTGIPNACAVCHAERNTGWSEHALRRWGAGPRRARRHELALARALQDGAVDPVGLRAAAADRGAAWPVRATAARLLGRAPEPASAELCRALLADDPHPMVRAGAAFGLVAHTGPADPQALPALRAALGDPRRAVRVMAAAGLVLRGTPDDLRRGLREIEAVVAAVPDHLQMHKLLATGWERAGDVAAARQAHARCVTLAPRDPAVTGARDAFEQRVAGGGE